MNEEEPPEESFEDKLRRFAQWVSESMEQARGDVDLDRVADRIETESERLKEMTEFAARWLRGQAQAGADPAGSPSEPGAPPPARRVGPHPLDTPSEAQGLALSRLSSGRWTVQPGSNVLTAEGDETIAEDAASVVGELRARDWITAEGKLTLVGEDALRHWLAARP
jgi:hypothetical protein